jgi:ricin-type beta-trefoil lectin protein
MQRSLPRQGCAFAALSCAATFAIGCAEELSGVDAPDSAVRLLGPVSSLHFEGHPPHWTRWTTDGATAIESGNAFLAHGLRCSGKYCDDLGLLSVESGYGQTNSWWTDSFSEEGQNYRICGDNGFVTGIACSGKYCDNVSLRCSQLDNGGVRSNCYWTAPVSDDDGGHFVAPEWMYVAGVSCNGRYCDNMNLYMCQVDDASGGFDYAALAAEFAPRLRFDQETTTGSGQQSKCFPGDPGAYVAARAQGFSAVSLCNKDYASVAEGRVPTYYVANQVGGNAVIIRYWYFYAWQSTCFGGLGAHSADWESMAVLIVDGQLRRVAFSQHGGWYSREPGGFELTGDTHPIGYVGKNAHGTYHDSGGSGGCLYFEDYRNPGGNDYHMDTWSNLVPLDRSSGSPDWMRCEGSGCFDGIPHPLDQTGDVRSMAGCGRDGCGRSSVGGNIPIIDDPTAAEYTTITAAHSGRAIDVPGASTGNGVELTQYTNWHVDNQRWLLEAVGDGTFTLRARHSGKCMDVAGASQNAGAHLIQWNCNGGNNQRFRLLSYGNGSYAVQVVHSNQCLDIAGGDLDDGGQLIQWPCAWTANQTFWFGL